MTDRPHFGPFEPDRDEGRALASLRETVAGADDGELFLERRRSESLVYDDGRLRTASYDSGEGFGLRAVVGEVAGYAHSTDLSEAALRRAAELDEAAPRTGHELVEAPDRIWQLVVLQAVAQGSPRLALVRPHAVATFGQGRDEVRPFTLEE